MSIEFKVDGGVAIITLNRPEARNAIDGATSQAVSDAIKTIESDNTIRTGVTCRFGGH